MPKDSTPICFRISDDDRLKLEAAAFHLNQSLSAFMRHAAVRAAEDVMRAGGGEAAVREQHLDATRRGEQFVGRDATI
jgi:Protein of unknown function (DUF1778)